MLPDKDRKAVELAARCFPSLAGYKTLHAIACLAGLKRIQDAFTEHVHAVLDASKDAEAPGIALFWVPPEHRGSFTTNAQVEAACKALEEENPSLKDSFTVLWPGATDSEVAAAWRHLQDLNWSTARLLEDTSEPAALRARFAAYLDRRLDQFLGKAQEQRDEPDAPIPRCVDVIGAAYEVAQDELGVKAGVNNGEFFTPENVVWLMARILGVRPGESGLDPCFGSGRMMIVPAADLILQRGHAVQETGPDHPLGKGHRLVGPPPAFFSGQDIAPHGPAMARISMTCLGYLNAVIVVRNSLSEPLTGAEIHAIIAERGQLLLDRQPRRLVLPEMQPPPPAPASTASTAAPRTTRTASLDLFM